MSGVNKVILLGRLGQDPDVKTTAAGASIANISIATSESWKDKNTGEKKERTEWHRVIFFGKLAEIVGRYAKKGTQMYVEGQLRTQKWQDKDGADRYTTEVVVQGFGGSMQLLGDNGVSNSNNAASGAPNQNNTPQTPPQDDLDMDIPF